MIDSVQSNSYCWLSVISTFDECSVNEPVHSRRWGTGVYSTDEPVQSWRVGLREWTGLSAEGHPP
jgi:hypothetical protein